MASGSAVILDRPWAKKVISGTGGRKSEFKREEYVLSVCRSYEHWCGNSYANLKLEHIVWTKPHERGKVAKAVTQLCGSQNVSSTGRCDIRLKLPPPYGRVYGHVLAWYLFWNDGQFDSFPEFRDFCWRQGWDVDHGPQGNWKILNGEWRQLLNVHQLTLKRDTVNRGQGESVRQHYENVRLRHVARG